MFGGLYFGQYWPEGAQQADAGVSQTGDFIPDAYKKKRKAEEAVQWPQPWQFEKPAPPKPKVEPKPEPVVARPVAAVLPGRKEVVVFSESIKEQARLLELRMKRQLEEEELLTLMGFFD